MQIEEYVVCKDLSIGIYHIDRNTNQKADDWVGDSTLCFEDD